MIGVRRMGRNLFDGRLVASAVMGLMAMAACGDGDTPTPTPLTPVISPPPFEGKYLPKADVDLVVIGEVTDVTWVLESSLPDQPGFCYYDATVTVERTIFGPFSDTITIRQARNSLSSVGAGFISTKRGMKEGDRIVAFLGRDTSMFDLNEDQFVSQREFWIQGQEVAKYVPFGGFASADECAIYTGQRYERETQPLNEVVAWLEEYSQVVLSTGN